MIMNEKEDKLTIFLKLFVAFTVGFMLWKFVLLGLELIIQRYEIDTLWIITLSRFALLGYLLPFIVWLYFEPQKIYPFRFGDTKARIQMPFVWYGIRDNVVRVSIVFSSLCLVFAAVFFYTNRISVNVLFVGFTFAVVNSVLEEILWRGLILSRTIQLCGEKYGLTMMSLTFGLYHYPLGFSLPICLFFSLGGIYFGGIAIRSKGLLLGMVMHISMNVLFVTLGIIF